MIRLVTTLALCVAALGIARAADATKARDGVSTLPMAISRDFEFRKTKLYFLDPAPPKVQTSKFRSFTKGSAGPDAALGFERSYRLFGAVTKLDQQQRFGHYFDFFWRAKREADVTVRLEYRQEKLRSFVQAREVHYPHARGSNETEFRIIGDDFLDDGKVIAWRCLLIVDGHIVAQDRSYLWE